MNIFNTSIWELKYFLSGYWTESEICSYGVKEYAKQFVKMGEGVKSCAV